jgi:ribosomal protein S18 acetylase RimI-like enzyme
LFVIEKPKEIHLATWRDMFMKSQERRNHEGCDFDLFWASALKENCYAFCAKNDGEFLGFAVARSSNTFIEKYIHLEILFVDPNYRKIGVGRALLNKVEEISSTLGLNLFVERVEKTNLIAQRLLNDYQKIDLMIYKKKFN